MKKIILLALILTLYSCYDEEDPLKYKGCVVVNKNENKPSLGNVQLKLTPELRTKYKKDYIWIGVVKFDRDKLNIGDTIK